MFHACLRITHNVLQCVRVRPVYVYCLYYLSALLASAYVYINTQWQRPVSEYEVTVTLSTDLQLRGRQHLRALVKRYIYVQACARVASYPSLCLCCD